MKPTPHHVLVLGGHSDAIRMGQSLQGIGVPVTFLGELKGGQMAEAPNQVLVWESADLILFGVEPDHALNIAKQLQRRVLVGTPVIALLPGIRRLTWMAHAAPGLHWIQCVVRHGVWSEPILEVDGAHQPRMYLSESAHVRRWRACLEHAGYKVDLRSDLHAVQWGLALLQLASLMVLVSGQSYQQSLKDRSWRTRLSRLWDEVLGLMSMSGIEPLPLLGVPWRVAPLMLKLGDAPFAWMATRHLLALEGEVEGLIPLDGPALDMAVDASCGEVMRLAIGLGEDAPCAAGLAGQLKATRPLFASQRELHSV